MKKFRQGAFVSMLDTGDDKYVGQFVEWNPEGLTMLVHLFPRGEESSEGVTFFFPTRLITHMRYLSQREVDEYYGDGAEV